MTTDKPPAPVVCFRCRRPVGFVYDAFITNGWRAVCFCFGAR